MRFLLTTLLFTIAGLVFFSALYLTTQTEEIVLFVEHSTYYFDLVRVAALLVLYCIYFVYLPKHAITFTIVICTIFTFANLYRNFSINTGKPVILFGTNLDYIDLLKTYRVRVPYLEIYEKLVPLLDGKNIVTDRSTLHMLGLTSIRLLSLTPAKRVIGRSRKITDYSDKSDLDNLNVKYGHATDLNKLPSEKYGGVTWYFAPTANSRFVCIIKKKMKAFLVTPEYKICNDEMIKRQKR